MEKTIKSYEIKQEIGEGGFAKVYRAYQSLVDREVAIKAILPVYANHPDFVRRFEAEAQLVARLEHPHIVPLYDFWRDPDGAFLVMRWLRGGNLLDLLRTSGGTIELEIIAKLLDQITGALSMAHRHGVVHQDIKPENILLDEDGNAYLTDFGIAKDLETGLNLAQVDGSNVVHGSPAYISPEHLLQDKVTQKSDIYSLGLLLFEILTGQKPWEDADETNQLEFLRHRFKTLKLPTLQTVKPELPEGLNQVVWQATARKPSSRYDSAVQLADDFRRCIQQDYPTIPTPHTTPTGTRPAVTTPPLVLTKAEPINPYKGLRPFQEADADDFFGRTALVERLANQMAEDGKYGRFLAVVGPSGSGKSSVVKAGLIPAIRNGKVENLPTPFIVQITPGPNPLRELEGAILRIATRADDAFITSLSTGNYLLSEITGMALPPGDSQLVLVIDQFEEVFTLVENEDVRRDFLGKIHEAVTAPKSRVRVIITLRGDFFDRPLSYVSFGDLLQARTEVVLPLSKEELTAAIQSPADRAGLLVEAGLVETIVTDVGQQPNMLPLLQYALTELYEQREHLKLTLAAYQKSGGISGALARRAEELYNEFDPPHQAAIRQLFLRLVKLGEGTEDTRRRALQSELYSMQGNVTTVRKVMDTYGKYRLLTFDHDPTTRMPTVEVGHEALIRSWARFREWLNNNRDELRTQARLIQATTEWLTAERDSSFLATGARLAQFEALANSTSLALSQDEQTYVEASLALRQRQINRRRMFIVMLAVISIVAVVAAVIALALRHQSEEHRQEAVAAEATAVAERDRADLEAKTSRSRELAASALTHIDDLDLSLLLSLEALAVADTFEAQNSLLTVLQYQPRLETFLNGHTDAVRCLAYSPDGRLIASGSADNTIILWDTAARQPVGSPLTGHLGRVNALAFSPDGDLLVSGGDDGTVRLWDVEKGQPLGEPLLGHELGVRSVAFSPDGHVVASGGLDNTIRLWDVETGELANPPLQGHEQAVYSVAFSPDGQILASGGDDGAVRLWDMDDFDSRVLQGHVNWVLSLAFSPDGHMLASGSADENIRLWNVETGEALGRALVGHRSLVRGLDFHAQGRLLVSGGDDGLVIIWDTTTGQILDYFANLPPAAVWDIALSPDMTTIAVGGMDNALALWHLQTPIALGQVLGHHDEQILSVAFQPNGPLLASGGGFAEDMAIRLWDISTGTLQATLEGHEGSISALDFNPANTAQLAAADLARRVMVWDIERVSMIRVIEFGDSVFSLDYSAGGRLLALGNNDGTISLWDVTGSPEDWHAIGDPLTGHTDRVTDVAFSPDGTILASASRDHTLRLWEVATGQPVGDPLSGHTDGVLSLAFSPDGALLASGGRDTTIRLWNARDGQPIGDPLTEHSNWVMDVAFSPDGRYLASSSGDGTIILWDVTLRRAFGNPLIGHTDWVNSLAFSGDGAYLASGGRDSNVIVWSVGLAEWQRRACDIANRNLTPDELQLYFRDADSHAVCLDS